MENRKYNPQDPRKNKKGKANRSGTAVPYDDRNQDDSSKKAPPGPDTKF